MKKMIIVVLLFAGLIARSQTPPTNPKSKVDIGRVTAQFLVSTDFSSVFFNFVGTGFRYTKGRTSISISVFPSLRFHTDDNPDLTEPKRPFLTAGFALGPVVQYKRLVVGFPAYYDSHDVRWRYAVGVGLKIGQ